MVTMEDMGIIQLWSTITIVITIIIITGILQELLIVIIPKVDIMMVTDLKVVIDRQVVVIDLLPEETIDNLPALHNVLQTNQQDLEKQNQHLNVSQVHRYPKVNQGLQHLNVNQRRDHIAVADGVGVVTVEVVAPADVVVAEVEEGRRDTEELQK
jgi:hypothetical protein